MSLTPDECAAVRWDVIVIGTGMGGATSGYELARRGRKVLFIEKGPFLHADFAAAPSGLQDAVVRPTEADARELPRNRDERLAGGHWPHRFSARTNLGNLSFLGPVGCVTGGSSTFYAAALERFAPADFAPRANFKQCTATTLPDQWPVSYAELEPYYSQAEQLFRVRGTQDPLHGGGVSSLLEPPSLSARDQRLMEIFDRRGLHPYRVHVGCDFVAGCDGCPDGPCEKNCKRDAAWTCLIPSLADHGAHLIPDCEVLRLDAAQDRVNTLICRQGERELHLRADVVVLAGGAFATPALLLRSRSELWPQGVGNQNDLVGRNLMFHGGDFIAISPGEALNDEGAQKTLAINDFYAVDDEKLGTFQTLGVRLEIGQIMQYLRENAELSTAWWKWLLSPQPVWWRKLTSPFVRLGAMVYYYIFNFRDASVWVSILEDLPYHDNRVYPHPDKEQEFVIEYQYADDMKRRVARFRKHLRKVLGSRRLMILSHENKIDFPHVSGTCRFGNDPQTSVLNANNRVHGINNLYVMDASCFPSSGGTNPSLTIAALALRAAENIDSQLATAPADTEIAPAQQA